MEDVEVKLNLLTRELFVNGSIIELTGREAMLLAALARAGVGTIVSRDELLRGRHVTSRVIDSAVHSIRKKLKREKWWLVETRSSRGYCLVRPVSLEF